MWKSLLFLITSSVALAGPSHFVTSVRHVYLGSPVNTVTPFLLVPAMPKAVISGVTVYDSSGQTMQLIVTSAGPNSTYVIVPTGSSSFPLQMNQNDSVSVIGLSGTASTGELDVNFFY